VHRHLLRPAARTGILAASAAAVLTAVLVSPAGAAPGHQAGAAPARRAAVGGERSGRLPVPYREYGPPGQAVPTGTPEHTLTVKAANLAGKPDTGGAIQLFGIDGLRLPPLAKSFEHGVATFQVPAGHYFGLASFPGATKPKSLRTVVLPQVTVTGNTTVTVHETAASSKLTMVTPRPATVIDSDVWFQRSGASGAPVTLEGYFTSSEQLWFSPTKVKPTVGTLRMSVNQHLESPPGPGVPYEYTLSFTGPPGVIPPQRHLVPASGLATITERFYQPFTSRGGWVLNGEFPASSPNTSWFGFIEPVGPGLKLPRGADRVRRWRRHRPVRVGRALLPAVRRRDPAGGGLPAAAPG
jgi:hypothetical protein